MDADAEHVKPTITTIDNCIHLESLRYGTDEMPTNISQLIKNYNEATIAVW